MRPPPIWPWPAHEPERTTKQAPARYASDATCARWAMALAWDLLLVPTNAGSAKRPLLKRSGSFATARSMAAICRFMRSRFPLHGRTRNVSGWPSISWQKLQAAPNLQPAGPRLKAHGLHSPLAWPAEPTESGAASWIVVAESGMAPASAGSVARCGCSGGRVLSGTHCGGGTHEANCVAKKVVSASKKPAPGVAASPADTMGVPGLESGEASP
mmetsp:Transcript_52297/g.150660  ORF Transcript_52297/g.150660 Transcript_52297/m.150660 type:complete len:214 (-) Transcript_52297:357-998(-)